MAPTLTGKSELTVMRAAAARGFKVKLVNVGLRDVAYSTGRVSNRVAAGRVKLPPATAAAGQKRPRPTPLALPRPLP